jgi:hypothetical protein
MVSPDALHHVTMRGIIQIFSRRTFVIPTFGAGSKAMILVCHSTVSYRLKMPFKQLTFQFF